MKKLNLTRRKFLTGSAATAAGTLFSGAGIVGSSACKNVEAKRYHNGRSPWPVSLDTATIRPAETLKDKIRIAAEAGYGGFEPWEGELTEYEDAGGDLKELGKEINDLGMAVPNIVGLWNAIPATREEWDEIQTAHRNRFRQASEIGAEYIQSVLVPAREWHEYDLYWAAERYHDLLEIGIGDYNVIPALNFLQFLPHNKQIGQASAIALNADHPDAKIIPDTFHMYVGGSGWNALKHLKGSFIAVFQINDVPSEPAREELEDAHRIFPGDGIFPLEEILTDLKKSGYKDYISLQLFNEAYWKRNLLDVAKEGLEKTLQVIERANV